MNNENNEPELVIEQLKDGTKFQMAIFDGNPYVTMETAGILIGYSDPAKGVSNLYNNRKEELEEYVKSLNSRELTESPRGVKCFSRQGFNLLCMFADTEMAKQRRKEILEVMERYETKGMVVHPDLFKDPLKFVKLSAQQILALANKIENQEEDLREFKTLTEKNIALVYKEMGNISNRLNNEVLREKRIAEVKERVDQLVIDLEQHFTELFEQYGEKTFRKKAYINIWKHLFRYFDVSNLMGLSRHILNSDEGLKKVLLILTTFEELYFLEKMSPTSWFTKYQLLAIMCEVPRLTDFSDEEGIV